MHVITQLKLCLHEQIQIVANAACRVGNQRFLNQAIAAFRRACLVS